MTNDRRPRQDVRMRGFTARSTVEEAVAWTDAATTVCADETVPLTQATGRILARDIVATIDVPPFARSAMDGYAVRAEETSGATDYNPLSLQVVGQSLPGQPFSGRVQPGQAVRIMTGAPMAVGADAVVPVEFTQIDETTLRITQAVAAAKHVGQIGEDIALGSRVLAAGRRLRPQDLGVIASVGSAEVQVTRRPRVRVLTTGNELASPGETRNEFQIYDANTVMLRALVTRDGGVIESAVHVADSPSQIQAAMTGEADVVLVGGGSSVGAEDFAPQVLAEQGELCIHGIAMRPSSPTGMGRIGQKLVFLLPGNPVSCLCAYDFFAGRAIRRMAGGESDWPYRRRPGVLNRKIASAIGRVDYCRVTLDGSDCVPLAISGASILSSTTRADGFVVVPGESEGYAAGCEVDVFCY